MEPGNANYELSYASGAVVDYLSEIGSCENKNVPVRENIEKAFDEELKIFLNNMSFAFKYDFIVL